MERKCSPEFVKYMNMIVNHPNYNGLPIIRKEDGSLTWLAPAKTVIGQKRIAWAKDKAKEFGLNPDEAGVYAKVMFLVHPTKEKVCQICGKKMSLYYLYPNANMQKSILEKFGYEVGVYQTISDVVKDLLASGVDEPSLKQYLLKSFKLSPDLWSKDIEGIIKLGEKNCRDGICASLGPGAMSNFPDRYDGFHSYNRCCRSKEDKGRNPENMKTYNKDRRAYEMWSDGNIHAANQFMKSPYFRGVSADHVGPISLGFIHDSHYLRPLTKGENSTKRDRLLFEDINEIIQIETKTGISPINWYSKKIWEYIKLNYQLNQDKLEIYRDALKQNVHNYLSLLKIIVDNTGENGKIFLKNTFIVPKYDDFKYNYRFDSEGNILSKELRKESAANKKELDRYIRIAFESIDEYSEKNNRNLKTTFNPISSNIDKLCNSIKSNPHSSLNKKILVIIVIQLQGISINNIEKA